jgi:hypothetical protein
VSGTPVGGIDFGYRNPFAAVWGSLDGNDVLWLIGERYAKERGLHEHLDALPREVTWYADPSHPTEIQAFRKGELVVRPGDNAIAAGIAAVRARIETGRLRIDPERCPNLLREAELYHYDPDGTGEVPVDADNHALAALRYLVSRIDANFLRRWKRRAEPDVAVTVPDRDRDENDPRWWEMTG